MKHNIFQRLPDNPSAEVFETILARKGFTLERIISRGHATPKGEWLSQKRDEWVLLACGRATLAFEDEGNVSLEPGDFVFVPAGKKHRVEQTSFPEHTVWLALHCVPEAPVFRQRPQMEVQRVKVMRSGRRKRTAGARLLGGTLYVTVPEDISTSELQRMIRSFKKRFERKRLKQELNDAQGLRQVAERLNRKYFGGSLSIDSIEYVTNQSSKFGCCDYGSGSIRISSEVAAMPDWVRDYVILHELAHLKVHGHGRRFHQLVARYPLAERAKGFLMARGMEPREE